MCVGRPVIRALRAAAFTAVCVLASAALYALVAVTRSRRERSARRWRPT
ncbi:hypothetical protein [Nonomuraea sp. NPDC005501]